MQSQIGVITKKNKTKMKIQLLAEKKNETQLYLREKDRMKCQTEKNKLHSQAARKH